MGVVIVINCNIISNCNTAPTTASNSVRWDRLQREKTALEVAFERELQELQLQQEAELAAVEEGLRKCHSADTEHLKAEHRSEMEELRTQQQEQVREGHHGRCVRYVLVLGKSDQTVKDICVWGCVRWRR